jgi:F-type H+-transporting ATPase subunit epsilon
MVDTHSHPYDHVRDRTLHCVVVTPERALLDETADFVALPMYDGELGVLPGRAPLIGRLGYGELRIRRGSNTQHFFVDGGFAQVRANTVTVLTSKALRATEIDTAAAARLVEQPQASGGAPQTAEQRHRVQETARVQLRIARQAGGGGTTTHTGH